MRALGLVLLAGCNQVFGLQPTISVDATFFDAPAPTCPTTEPPHLSPTLHQISSRRCESYTRAGTLAVAYCFPDDQQSRGILYEATGDDEMVPAMIAPSAGFDRLYTPRLSPEGDALFVQQWNGLSNAKYSVYQRTGSSWTYAYDLPFNPLSIGSPTRGPGRRMLAMATLDSLVELDESMGWTSRMTYTAGQLGVSGFINRPIYLSADGLRMTFSAGGGQMFYAFRPSMDVAFGAATVIDDLPVNIYEAFLDESCGRVYFPAIGVIFYLEQVPTTAP